MMMLPIALFFMSALIVQGPMEDALKSWDNVGSYHVTLRSRTQESGVYSEVIRYFYKKPGFIRMEFENPYSGAVLVYDPAQKKVKIRLSGVFKVFGVFTFSPDSSVVKSSRGHRVDESDIGSLLKMVRRLQDGGGTKTLDDEPIGGRAAVQAVVEGSDDFSVDGIHRYRLWLDKDTKLPLRVKAYDLKGALIEEVLMDDLEVGVKLNDEMFVP